MSRVALTKWSKPKVDPLVPCSLKKRSASRLAASVPASTSKKNATRSPHRKSSASREVLRVGAVASQTGGVVVVVRLDPDEVDAQAARGTRDLAHLRVVARLDLRAARASGRAASAGCGVVIVGDDVGVRLERTVAVTVVGTRGDQSELPEHEEDRKDQPRDCERRRYQSTMAFAPPVRTSHWWVPSAKCFQLGQRRDAMAPRSGEAYDRSRPTPSAEGRGLPRPFDVGMDNDGCATAIVSGTTGEVQTGGPGGGVGLDLGSLRTGDDQTQLYITYIPGV